MDVWTQILTVPSMGGGFVLSIITFWLLFLVSLVLWIARAPREEKR